MMKGAIILMFACLLLITSVCADPQSMTIFGSQNIGLSSIQVMFEGNPLNSQIEITSDSYSVEIPGDDLETPEREGPVEGNFVTITFNNISQDFVWIPVVMQIDILQEYIPPEINITPPYIPPLPEFNGTIPPENPPVEPEQNETPQEPVAPPSPPPAPPSSGGGSSGGDSSGGSSSGGSSGSSHSSISPVPKFDNATNATIIFVYHDANETKEEQVTVQEKGIIPEEESESKAEKKGFDLSYAVMIGLGIILILELFFIINLIVKMKKK